ncbi:MAG: zinc ribbon domain-containing protein [Myxococcales bacterium]|nr:zinc ribbon domain-containing protein [Myxococcales bacterium]
MPTYEYACTSCGNEWEAEQSIKEDPLTECPKCHEPSAKRQISRGTGFILKGGGWYSDLYSGGSNAKKPDAKPEAVKTESKSSDASSSASSSSSDSSSSTTATPAKSTPSSGS